MNRCHNWLILMFCALAASCGGSGGGLGGLGQDKPTSGLLGAFASILEKDVLPVWLADDVQKYRDDEGNTPAPRTVDKAKRALYDAVEKLGSMGKEILPTGEPCVFKNIDSNTWSCEQRVGEYMYIMQGTHNPVYRWQGSNYEYGLNSQSQPPNYNAWVFTSADGKEQTVYNGDTIILTATKIPQTRYRTDQNGRAVVDESGSMIEEMVPEEEIPLVITVKSENQKEWGCFDSSNDSWDIGKTCQSMWHESLGQKWEDNGIHHTVQLSELVIMKIELACENEDCTAELLKKPAK